MKVFVLLLMLSSVLAQAQSEAEKQAIMKPITALFTGMNLGDSAMVHRAFADEATMASISKDKAGRVQLRKESSLMNFLKAVGTPHQEPWSEPIWDVHIEEDGDFAQVWANYAFYLGKKFSHCGVDAFHLIKADGSWKIFYLVDTRRKEGCYVPEAISKKFN